MPLPIIAGVVRCAVRGMTPNGTPWTNIHHMQYAGGASSPGQTEITAMDSLLVRLYTGTAFSSGIPWLTNCGGLTQLNQIDYYILDGTSLGYSIAHQFTSGASNNNPSEVASVLTLQTGKRGRRYRGRVYLPAPNVASLDSAGNLTATVQNTTVTQYNGMLAALAPIQWVPVVASYGHGTLHGAPVTWTPFATPILTVRMDKFLDVQRRRKN